MTGDQQRTWSEDEKQEILRRGREIIAEGDRQDILRRDDGGLDEQRTSFSDEERDEILKTARAHVTGYDDEKFEIGEDGDREQRLFSPDEKAEILRTARDTLRRDATTGMIKKVTYNAPAARQADAASEARQPRQRRQWRRRAEADDAYFDPIESTGWPEPAKESKLDTCLEGLVADHVRTSFAEQHGYICELMAQVLADAVYKDGLVMQAIADALAKERRHHRIVERKLQVQINRLESALDDLRGQIALGRDRSLSLPQLPACRDLN